MRPRPRIEFTDGEMTIISRESGMSKLELAGLLSIMNRFTRSDEALRAWDHDEMMGRHI